MPCASFAPFRAEGFLAHQPADTLLPPLLLGVAFLLLLLNENVLQRFPISEWVYRLLIAMVLGMGLVSGGLYWVQGGEIEMGIGIVLAYGIPAAIALAVAYGMALLIDSRWPVQPQRGADPEHDASEPTDGAETGSPG